MELKNIAPSFVLLFTIILHGSSSILLPKNSTELGLLDQQSSNPLLNKIITFSIYEERLKNFFDFLLSDSPSYHHYVLYDLNNIDEFAPILPSLWDIFGSDLTLLPYEGSLVSHQPLLKATNYAGAMKNVIVLCSTEATLSIFKEVQLLSMENPTLRWLVFGEREIIRPLLALIREGTQVTFSYGDISDTIEVLTSHINIENNPSFRRLKSWQIKNDGTVKTRKTGPPRKDPIEEYNDFGGRSLLIATLRNIPFLDLVRNGMYVTPIGGIEHHMLEIMKRRLNFSFKMKLPPDGQWGEVFPNRSATGIVGMVARRDTDFCLGELTIMAAREEVVDFSQPYFTESTTLVTRAPKKLSQALALVVPFTLETWVFLVISTIVMGLILSIFGFILGEYNTESYFDRYLRFQYGVFRSMVYKDSELKFKYGATRLASGMWYLFCTFVYITYSNMLIAALIAPQYEKPIDSLEDMLQATGQGAKMLVNPGSSFEYIFKRADTGIYRDIWMNFDPSVGYVVDSKTGVSEVLKAWNVFVTAQMKSRVLSTMMGRKKFNIAKNSFYPQSYGMAFRSGSPFQAQFNDIIVRLFETGLINKWTLDELYTLERKSAFGSKDKSAETSTEEDEDDESLEPFKLHHLQAAFFLLAIGFLLSLFAFLVEVLVNKLRI